MGLIALITGTGNANCTRLLLVQFHTLPVPVTRAINAHIALSAVLLAIHSTWEDGSSVAKSWSCLDGGAM